MCPQPSALPPDRQVVLRVGAGLSFELRGFPDLLAKRIRSYFCHLLDPAGVVGEDALRVAVESCRDECAGEPAPILVDQPPMRIRGGSHELLFELPGIRCRCSELDDRARVLLTDSDSVPMAHFGPWLLVAVLFHLARRRGWLGLHAAAVELGGRAVLLPGPSGCGKSTLHRQAGERGLGVLSDDLVWLSRPGDDFRVRAFQREGDQQPTVDDLPLGHIVVPSIVAEAPSRLTPLPKVAAAKELMAQATFLPAGPRAREHFRDLVALAGSVPCHELKAGPSGDAIQVLIRHLKPPGGA